MSSLSPIDWNLVAEYLEAGCSGVEIAAQLGVHENTLYQRCKSDLDKDFVAFKQEKQASGDSILRNG
jgi:transposase-like protein